MNPSARSSHDALTQAAARLQSTAITELFAADDQRANQFRTNAAGIYLDYSKQRLDTDTRALLSALADACHLTEDYKALIGGTEVNNTEQRPALHTLLRGTAADQQPARHQNVVDALGAMEALVNAVHGGHRKGFDGRAFTDVVNIGIGGSDLGPRMICKALWTPAPCLRPHFVANVDPQDMAEVVSTLDPATTLFVVCSKSFTTEETLSNALLAREWLMAAGATHADIANHVVAVTTNLDAAEQFGIARDQCFPMWDWVGGRYSVWSAIGLVIALHLGWPTFTSLLAGGRAMDEHTATSQGFANLPMTMALLEWWNTLYLGTETHLVLPYAHRLSGFTDFLQQLTMESNGKRVTLSGEPLAHTSAPVLWGSAGTIGQHSYYQLLHQGNREFSADIILPLTNGCVDKTAHRKLAANALAQSRAMMIGRSPEEALELAASRGQDASLASHFVMPGNHPHSLLTCNQLNPESLGALIAAYEHKTFFLSRLFDINPFDQWGVELGKVIGRQIDAILESGTGVDLIDPSTAQMIGAWRAAND